MSWYNPGAGAGVWDGAWVNPDLRNVVAQLCYATNEREILTSTPEAASITRSGGTATLTCTNHGAETGDQVRVWGADQAAYNGLVTITKTGNDTFTYTVVGSPATPATGPIHILKNSAATEFTYNEDGDAKRFPTESDFEDMSTGWGADPPAFDVDSAGRVGTTARVECPGNGLKVGDSVNMAGADQADYNGWQTVTAVQSDVFQDVSSITRSGSTATATCTGHGYAVGDYVEFVNAAQHGYNGIQKVTQVPTADTFRFTCSASTTTPDGSVNIEVCGHNWFEFEIDAAAVTPATGTITATPHVHTVFGLKITGNIATIHAKANGFTTADWIEIRSEAAGNTAFDVYAQPTAVSTDTLTFAITASDQVATFTNFRKHLFRPTGVRVVLRELQAAIGGLLTSGVFVEDATPWETPYTLSSVLGAGSHGSTWLSLKSPRIEDVGAIVEQMREALDLLVVVRNPVEYEIRYRETKTAAKTVGAIVYPNGVSVSGDTVTFTTDLNHNLTTGDIVRTLLRAPGSFNFDVLADVTVVDATHYSIESAGWTDPEAPFNGFGYPVTQDDSWDRAIAATSTTESGTLTGKIASRKQVIAGDVRALIETALIHYSEVVYFGYMPVGTVLAAALNFLASYTGEEDIADTWIVTDSDTDVFDLNQSFTTTDADIEVDKSAVFADATKVLEFTSDIAGTLPFDEIRLSVSSLTRSGSTVTCTTSTAHGYSTGESININGAREAGYESTGTVTVTSSTQFTYVIQNGSTPTTPATGTIYVTRIVTPERYLKVNDADPGYMVRELVPGTDLTYG